MVGGLLGQASDLVLDPDQHQPALLQFGANGAQIVTIPDRRVPFK